VVLTRNRATACASLLAYSRRLSAAADDCSTRAAFCCVIWSSCVTVLLTWPMSLLFDLLELLETAQARKKP
jgi:hypothetical protein